MPPNHYRAAMRAPGFRRLLASSLVARLPTGMLALAILLLVSRTHGYGRAGVVNAVYISCAGVANLALARLSDRVGPRTVLLPASVVCLAGVLTLAVLPQRYYAADLLVAAWIGLSTPPVGTVVRASWSRLYDEEVRHQIYGLEAAAQELIFLVGPALVGLIAAVASPAVAVAVTGALGFAGTLACATAPAMAFRPERGTGRRRVALFSSGLARYTALAAMSSVCFNMTTVAVVGFVSGRHASAMSGAVLAVWSVGSLLGGLWFGSRGPAVTDRRLAASFVAIAASIGAAAASPGTWGLAIVLTLGGMTIAPALGRLNVRVAAVAPDGATTEAFGWISVGFMAGNACGSSLGGISVDAVGARATFLLAGAALLVGCAALQLGRADRGIMRDRLPSSRAGRQAPDPDAA